MPYSVQSSLGSAASHDKELLEGDPPEQPPRVTEVDRMKATGKQAEREERRATGQAEVQPGGTAAQVEAGAEYLEEMKDLERAKET